MVHDDAANIFYSSSIMWFKLVLVLLSRMLPFTCTHFLSFFTNKSLSLSVVSTFSSTKPPAFTSFLAPVVVMVVVVLYPNTCQEESHTVLLRILALFR